MITEFLKNLNEALANKIYIDKPNEQFGRFGYLGVIDPSKYIQLVCTANNNVNIGPSIPIEVLNNISSIDNFNIIHINQLVAMISNFALKILFIPLILPSHCEQAQLHRHKNIYGRYIKDYIPATDMIMGRTDFLIQKLD